MTRTLFTLTLIAVLGLFAAAQDSRGLPPRTVRENTQVVLTRPGPEPAIAQDSSYEPPFCPPKTCLYYAGDFESTYQYANGLFNSNYTAGQLVGQAWVGVRPDQDVTVTGATFVEFVNFSDLINPTPFAVQVGIKPGQAGKTVCSTSGIATLSIYQWSDLLDTWSITIKKLSKSCKLKKGKVYYVNLLPTGDNGAGLGYVANVPPKPLNHHGWKNDVNDCYWNGTGFGNNDNYVTCDSQGSFSEFSIALTGKKTK